MIFDFDLIIIIIIITTVFIILINPTIIQANCLLIIARRCDGEYIVKSIIAYKYLLARTIRCTSSDEFTNSTPFFNELRPAAKGGYNTRRYVNQKFGYLLLLYLYLYLYLYLLSPIGVGCSPSPMGGEVGAFFIKVI